MGSTFSRVLTDYQRDCAARHRPLLILALTDGEANDKDYFNSILDAIQDGLYGDVQVCLMGLSLEPEDIEWFEAEECDDTRIRTIEAWEVEQQMILYRKVIPRAGDYSFAMHIYRALVTNYFPADYDYEAPLQTLRHRLYITLHALDRRFTGERDANRPNGLSNASDLGIVLPLLGGCAGGLYGGLGLMLCAAGLGGCAWMGLLAGAQRQQAALGSTGGGASPFEEALGDEDDRLIGELIRMLQSLAGQEASLPSQYSYGRRWRNRSLISPTSLSDLQYAVGTLSPNEVAMRDLQFQDVAYNNRALECALGYLRKAATDYGLGPGR